MIGPSQMNTLMIKQIKICWKD